MAGWSPYPDTDDTGVGLDRESTTGAPRWVKVFAVIGVVVVLLVVVVMLASGGEHGPWRHALGTRWGLFRHYWVLISFLLTVIATVVLLAETQTISYFADIAADPTTSGDHLRALGSTLVHSVGGTVVLLVILVLNVYKPQGMTRYGQRTHHDQRLALQQSKEDEWRPALQR